MQKIFRVLFNTRAAAFYLLAFALAIGTATFIENDFGTNSAQKLVYKARWFELLLLLFAGSLIANIVWFRMVQQKKWALLCFHLSIVLIIIGAAVTRYVSFEGIMPIREQTASNTFYSAESYLQIGANVSGVEYLIEEPLLLSALGSNSFHQTYRLGTRRVSVRLKNVIPNPKESLVADPMGGPILHIVLAGNSGRENFYLRPGDVKQVGAEVFNFTFNTIPGAHRIELRGDTPLLYPANSMSRMEMASQQLDTISPQAQPLPLKLKSLHSTQQTKFVFKEFLPHASIKTEAETKKMTNESIVLLELEVGLGDSVQVISINGSTGLPGAPRKVKIKDTELSFSYGAILKTLPFSIALKDFQMERYPGTNSAASYASEVQVQDPENGVQLDYRIYMNHILDYRGYRFFQSSFDNDEKGTYLSVNHDFWGTWISYLGYALLTLGMALTFMHKQSRMQWLSKKIKEMSKSAMLIMFIFFCWTKLNAQTAEHIQHTNDFSVISNEHAQLFSTVVVQDLQGRMKPMHTLTREIMRKVYGKEMYNKLNADQTILSMFFQKQQWINAPIIRVGEYTKKLLGVEGKYATYADFFSENGEYKLAEEIDRVFTLKPVNQGTSEKELMKVDERLNIISMVFSGSIFKIVPIEGDQNNTWSGVDMHAHNGGHEHAPSIPESFFVKYTTLMSHAIHSGDFSKPNLLLNELKAYQIQESAAIVPGVTKLKAEILLNESKVFSRLALLNLVIGLIYLGLLFLSVFRTAFQTVRFQKVLFYLVCFGFLMHSTGLGLRWYVSGRAPWSNGYESMIYIAWTATLAGLIFTRKSIGGLAATLTLSATVLLIAQLSYLDPEITPLVPVLNSYWLTIHVSLEAGSYGFLVLGAIIGIINLLLMSLSNARNRASIKRVVTEMSYLSEMTLLGGLLMLATGTYLGGVWANESWGRYWGWDAKETWALVSILVYAFILHMRIVPGLKGLYLFNVASLFGLASIIMTYFGVNYYLSGLHSYAAGDPIPIPFWVYVSSVSLILLSVFAYRGNKYLK